jgi:hypothetical protein
MYLLCITTRKIMRENTEHQPHKTMLVTGGAKRIGRGIALAGATVGFDVAVHYHHNKVAAKQTASEIERLGRRAVIIEGDLADPQTAEFVVKRAREVLGTMHLLINNASIFRKSTLMDFDMTELDSEVRINAFSPLLLSRAFAAQADSGASIINLLDSRMNAYDSTHVAYHLSKRMLYDITRLLALELAPTIRVNGVAPGLILPPAGEDEGYLDRNKKENPLNRHGSVEEIADAVLYLARSPFVTGQVIYVDGGRHLLSSVYG